MRVNENGCLNFDDSNFIEFPNFLNWKPILCFARKKWLQMGSIIVVSRWARSSPPQNKYKLEKL